VHKPRFPDMHVDERAGHGWRHGHEQHGHVGAMDDADDDGMRPSKRIVRLRLKKAKKRKHWNSIDAGTPLLRSLGSEVEVLGEANVDFTGTMGRVNFEGAMDETGTHFSIDGIAWRPRFGTTELPPQPAPPYSVTRSSSRCTTTPRCITPSICMDFPFSPSSSPKWTTMAEQWCAGTTGTQNLSTRSASRPTPH